MPSIEISTEIDYSIDGNTTSPEEPIDYPPSSSVRLLSSIIQLYRLIIAQLQKPQERRLQLLSFLLLVWVYVQLCAVVLISKRKPPQIDVSLFDL